MKRIEILFSSLSLACCIVFAHNGMFYAAAASFIVALLVPAMIEKMEDDDF